MNISELINDPQKLNEAFQEAIFSLDKKMADLLVDYVKNPRLIYEYANYIVNGKVDDKLEDIIAQDSNASFYYASEVLKGPFPKGEKAISQDISNSYHYARDVLKSRFPKGEQTILQDPYYSTLYAQQVIKRPWPEAEDVISKNSFSSYLYAKDVLKRPFIKGENEIIGSGWEEEYLSFLSEIGELENFYKRHPELNKKANMQELRKIDNQLMENIFKKAVSISNLPIDIKPENYEKIYNLVYMDPTIKNVKIESYDEFINQFTIEWKGKKAVDVKKIKMLDGKFLGMLNKFYDKFLEYGKENVRNALMHVKEHQVSNILDKKNTFEDIIVQLGLEKGKIIEKPKEDYRLVAEETLNGINYKLYEALTPEGIKKLANSGFNTWCVNSIDHARSYFDESRKHGFWYIFKNNNPFFAIGGRDGISSLFNVSLSENSTILLDTDYEILKKWQSIYNYPLVKQEIITKEEMEKRKENLIKKINNKEPLKSKDFELMFTYSDDFREKMNINNLLEVILETKEIMKRGDGEKIDIPELLTFVAKFIERGPFEKNEYIKREILEKVQDKISSDFNASLNYLLSVVKGYKEEYKKYRDKFLENMVKQTKFYDEDNLDDLISFLKLLERNNQQLTDEEKQYLNQIYQAVKERRYLLIPSIEIANKLGLNYDINKIIEDISKNPTDSYEYALSLIEQNKEIPPQIVDGISKDPGFSYDFAELLIERGKEIPPQIVDGISKDSRFSYEFAKLLIERGKEVPPQIVNGISKDSEFSYDFAKLLVERGKEVPPQIIESILRDFFMSYTKLLVEQGKEAEVPSQIVNLISEDPIYAYKYAESLIEKGKEIPPQIVDGISKSSTSSYNFALLLIKHNKEVPSQIIESIAKNAETSLYFAQLLIEHNKKVPPRIIEGISTNPMKALRYIEFLTERGKEVPHQIMESVLKNPWASFHFTRSYIEHGKEVPPPIIESILKDPESSSEYAKLLIKRGKENEFVEFVNQMKQKGMQIDPEIESHLVKLEKAASFSNTLLKLNEIKQLEKIIKKAQEENEDEIVKFLIDDF